VEKTGVVGLIWLLERVRRERKREREKDRLARFSNIEWTREFSVYRQRGGKKDSRTCMTVGVTERVYREWRTGVYREWGTGKYPPTCPTECVHESVCRREREREKHPVHLYNSPCIHTHTHISMHTPVY